MLLILCNRAIHGFMLETVFASLIVSAGEFPAWGSLRDEQSGTLDSGSDHLSLSRKASGFASSHTGEAGPAEMQGTHF